MRLSPFRSCGRDAKVAPCWSGSCIVTAIAHTAIVLQVFQSVADDVTHLDPWLDDLGMRVNEKQDDVQSCKIGS